MSEFAHPLPYASWETRGWWEGAGRGELVLQRCTSCGLVQHKPRAICVKCLTPTIEHFVASGTGTVHTFTVTHQNMAPPFNAQLPYVLAYVELDEGPRVLTNIVGADAGRRAHRPGGRRRLLIHPPRRRRGDRRAALPPRMIPRAASPTTGSLR